MTSTRRSDPTSTTVTAADAAPGPAGAAGRPAAVAEPPVAVALRRILLVIAGLTVLGTVLELASIDHWQERSQLIAWFCLALLVVAIGLVARSSSARAIQAARLLCAAVAAGGLLGMVAHVHGNYEAGPLDAVYGDQWETMSELSRWWAALIKSVGPSPALAPGVLIVAALCIAGATYRHPALEPEPAG